MEEFIIDYEPQFAQFETILATCTTGEHILDATPSISRKGSLHHDHSGPNGGGVQIAAEIVIVRCDIVIFFVDSLSAHRHIDDIRMIFSASIG